MIALTWSLLAQAADPHWVGIPLGDLESIGLAPPTHGPPVRGPQSLRYPLHTGGLVAMYVTADEASASLVFDGLTRTGATHWPVPTVSIPSDRQMGDGQTVALVQLDNVVLMVRSLQGDAAAVVERLRGALVAEEAACAGISREEPDGTRFDGCGRRLH
jgi:hypothetical protein